jgi:hypothetical protein
MISSMKCLPNVFLNSTSWTCESVVLIVNPLCKCKTGGLSIRGVLMVMLMSALCVFGAAMFAEPPISEVEEVGRLMHGIN